MTAIGTPDRRPAGRRWAEGAVRWVVAIGGAMVVFGAVIWAKGVNPFAAYPEMLTARSPAARSATS